MVVEGVIRPHMLHALLHDFHQGIAVEYLVADAHQLTARKWLAHGFDLSQV
ncbi:uncharacterized protein METZ01_LOCUS137687 [marine metagenome]|uniref:Uncharacterized protein n=1 Tax=marine metagenome TaxID=408172 RepID=A0A381Z7S5_9ZZZZ